MFSADKKFKLPPVTAEYLLNHCYRIQFVFTQMPHENSD